MRRQTEESRASRVWQWLVMMVDGLSHAVRRAEPKAGAARKRYIWWAIRTKPPTPEIRKFQNVKFLVLILQKLHPKLLYKALLKALYGALKLF